MDNKSFNPELNKEVGGFEIIDAEPQDAHGIATVRKIGWETAYKNLEHGITQEDIDSKNLLSEATIAKRHEELAKQGDAGHTWVMKADGKVVGYCTAGRGERAEIQSLYIAPEFQGQGLGTKFIEYALSWIGSGKDTYIDSVEYNTRALNLYKKLGFQETGQTKESRFSTGKTMKVLILKRKGE